jgi:hypothetical protein
MAFRFLRWFFLVVLALMIWVTWRATQDRGVVQAFWEIANDPWGLATLFDAYFGFLTFYAWLFYREGRAAPRVLWLVAILLLGNIAMAIYMLIALARLPAAPRPSDLLLRAEDRCPDDGGAAA